MILIIVTIPVFTSITININNIVIFKIFLYILINLCYNKRKREDLKIKTLLIFKSVKNMDGKTLNLLVKKYDFRLTKNNSLYLKIKRLGKKVLILRLSNHYKYIKKDNEVLLNYIYKNDKDFLRIIKKISLKFNLNIIL